MVPYHRLARQIMKAYDAGGSGSSSSDDDYLQDHTYLSRYYANHHSTPEASPPGTPAK